jgi:hypothetical protein
MTKPTSPRPAKKKLPRSFKDLTPSGHFKPATFFRELIWKGWLTPRTGEHRAPVFPKLKTGEVAITWIGHASFLIQFTELAFSFKTAQTFRLENKRFAAD